MVTPGTYKHYKGGLYQVLMNAVDDNTREELVVYIPLYAVDGKQTVTVRTAKNFTERMPANEGGALRFQRID